MNENSPTSRGTAETAPVTPDKFKILFTRAAVFEDRGNVAEALATYRQIIGDLSNKEAKSEFGEWVRQAIRRLQEEDLSRTHAAAEARSMPRPRDSGVRAQVAQRVTAALDRPAPDARGVPRATSTPAPSPSSVLQLVVDPQFATMSYQDLLQLVFASPRTPQEDEHRLALLLTTLAQNPDNIDVAWKLAEYYVCQNDPANAVAAHRHIESCYVRMEQQGPPLSGALITDRSNNFRQLANNLRRLVERETASDILPANPDLSPEYLATKRIHELVTMRIRLNKAGRLGEAVIIQKFIIGNFQLDRLFNQQILVQMQLQLEKSAPTNGRNSSTRHTSGNSNDGGGFF